MHFATSLQMCSCRTFLSALQKNLFIHPEKQLSALLSLAFLFSSLFQKGVFIMKVTIIHGQSHKGSTYHIAHNLAEKLCQNTYQSYDRNNMDSVHDTLSTENSITEFFLPRDFDNYCVGCTQCFMQSEKKCPHYDEKKDPIECCPICGRKNGNGDNNTCQKWIVDFTCPKCGQLVKANESHTHG